MHALVLMARAGTPGRTPGHPRELKAHPGAPGRAVIIGARPGSLHVPAVLVNAQGRLPFPSHAPRDSVIRRSQYRNQSGPYGT